MLQAFGACSGPMSATYIARGEMYGGESGCYHGASTTQQANRLPAQPSVGVLPSLRARSREVVLHNAMVPQVNVAVAVQVTKRATSRIHTRRCR